MSDIQIWGTLLAIVAFVTAGFMFGVALIMEWHSGFATAAGVLLGVGGLLLVLSQ